MCFLHVREYLENIAIYDECALLTATVDPFFPFPSNKILFNIGGKLHNAQIVPNTRGQYRNGRKPSS